MQCEDQQEQKLEMLIFWTNYCRSVRLSVLDNENSHVSRFQEYYYYYLLLRNRWSPYETRKVNLVIKNKSEELGKISSKIQ